MKKNQKSELCALIAGACISSALIVMFEKTMSLEDAFCAVAGFFALVFVPAMISGMILSRHENTFPLEAKVALLPYVTSMVFFFNWIIMCTLIEILKDESYTAVIVLTAFVAVVAACVTWSIKLPTYWLFAIACICGIVSISAYIWAGVLYSPEEVYGTVAGPEDILHYKTEFVFSWGWEAILAVTAFIVAIVPNYLKR